jgi:hypothetical protein
MGLFRAGDTTGRAWRPVASGQSRERQIAARPAGRDNGDLMMCHRIGPKSGIHFPARREQL